MLLVKLGQPVHRDFDIEQLLNVHYARLQAVTRPLTQQLIACKFFCYAEQLGFFCLAQVEMPLHDNLVPVFNKAPQNVMDGIDADV